MREMTTLKSLYMALNYSDKRQNARYRAILVVVETSVQLGKSICMGEDDGREHRIKSPLLCTESDEQIYEKNTKRKREVTNENYIVA